MHPPRRVPRVLLIDAMGTLVALSAPAPRLRRELEDRYGIAVSETEADRALRAEIAYYRAHLQEGHDAASVAGLRRRCAAILAGALPPAFRELELTEVLLASLHFEPFPDARPALARARADGRHVIVVSNWDASLPDVLAGVGLAGLIDGVVSSAAAGARKPDPAIFVRGLEVAGATPEEALHVGDSLEEDIAGAAAAGLPALWCNRGALPVPPGVQAISSLAELDPSPGPTRA
ncbi:MAG TPA: HAD-IA family hydrolase [Solirubrobacteraceae bacterium]|jgi:putative hydrolase of the HAD superfamily